MERKADPNASDSHGNTSLIYALINKDLNLAALLLKYDAKVNGGNKDNYTCLFFAAEPKAVQLLISHQADVNHMSSNRSTPLHLATHRNNKEVIKVLIENKADYNLKNSDGESLIDIARHNQWSEEDIKSIFIGLSSEEDV